MKPPKPVKPGRRPPSTQYHQAPPEEANVGKLFRVRCKDYDNVWGEHLSYPEAVVLKEKVASSGKSRTVRIEDESIPPPDWYLQQVGEMAPDPVVATGNGTAKLVDSELERLRAKAVAASRGAAQAAQERHARAAARDRSSPNAAKRVIVPPPPVPVIMTELPDIESGGEDDGQLGDNDLSDLMADAGADMPNPTELARARVQGAKVKAEITAKAQRMYEANMKEGHVAWAQLSKAAQAAWEFDAANAPADPPPAAEPDPVADANATPPAG